MKIAVVNSSSFGRYFPSHIKRLSALGKAERVNVSAKAAGKSLAKKLEGFDAVIASVSPSYNNAFFEANKGIYLISRHGVGVSNIDIVAATGAGVIVTKVPGSMERDSVAELTVTLLLQAARKIPPAVKAVKEDKWAERAKFTGCELRHKKVGIIGMGEIGSRTAEILKGFGARILAYDPYLKPEVIKKKGAKPAGLELLLRECDIISLHCPLNEQNYHLLGKGAFSNMKDGVIIVNTARGELIDEEALIEFLKKGKIGGVGMDVAEEEPVCESHPLLEFEEVVIVPHIAAYTRESLKRMGNKVTEDVERAARGEIPENVVNPDVLRKKNRAGIVRRGL